MRLINKEIYAMEWKSLNQTKRHVFILEKVKVNGEVNSKDLAEELNVSLMTINRDLKALSENGELELVYGGAVYKKTNLSEYPMTIKREVNAYGKKLIGEYCKRLVKPYSSIFIETGTTTLAVAHEIFRTRNCTFYSNSLMVLSTLSKHKDISLFSVPGEYRDLSQGFLGVQTIDYIKDFQFDLVFVGTEGITLEHGVTLPDEVDAFTKKAIINQAKQVVLVADKTKFGLSHLYKAGEVKDFDIIITDLPKDHESFKEMSHVTNIISVAE
ncbi:Glycerol-3-phosphate regulon repressor [Oceanobacillus picturae]|uniref:Glycerol-3-phosphate regulon repressor n=1 Tax=Oceanobacillus picturae TaxID=171693 RepID=W9AQ56_9BACI|nr:DeoR/GlpR family DNA-binding transcription regulator [Oceanobacillus picturae]CDO04756.1 Glycerol-3-phosphate regulon repressor [Oceanobacillus picturae]